MERSQTRNQMNKFARVLGKQRNPERSWVAVREFLYLWGILYHVKNIPEAYKWSLATIKQNIFIHKAKLKNYAYTMKYCESVV